MLYYTILSKRARIQPVSEASEFHFGASNPHSCLTTPNLHHKILPHKILFGGWVAKSV